MRMGGGRRGCGRNGFRASVSPLLGPPSLPTQRRTQGGAALNGGDSPSPNPSGYEVAFFQPHSITYGWLKALTLP